MSLILEALKKSERQRRLGETPSLGTPVTGVRRRRSLLPLLVGLIAVALAVGWWLRRAPGDETAIATGAPSAAPATSAPAVAATGSADAGAAAPTFAERSDPRQRVQGDAAARLPRSRVPADANAGINPAVREKLASGELVVANPALLKPGQPATVKESAPMPADSAPPDQTVPVSPPVARGGTRERATPAIAPAATPSPGQAVERTAQTKRDAAATPPPPPPAAADVVGAGPQLLWALPYAQRRGIPEIKLSMHVYAAEPAQRFVIINGNRQVEGDAFEGLKLIEIRNDGVVLEREGLRFVYPRGGR